VVMAVRFAWRAKDSRSSEMFSGEVGVRFGMGGEGNEGLNCVQWTRIVVVGLKLRHWDS
jgi:hypothetical protein